MPKFFKKNFKHLLLDRFLYLNIWLPTKYFFIFALDDDHEKFRKIVGDDDEDDLDGNYNPISEGSSDEENVPDQKDSNIQCYLCEPPKDFTSTNLLKKHQWFYHADNDDNIPRRLSSKVSNSRGTKKSTSTKNENPFTLSKTKSRKTTQANENENIQIVEVEQVCT